MGATALSVAMARAAESAKAGQQMTDVSELFYLEPREDVAEWLTRHGWQARIETPAQIAARYRPEFSGEPPDIGSEFVDAKLS